MPERVTTNQSGINGDDLMLPSQFEAEGNEDSQLPRQDLLDHSANSIQ